MFTIPLLVLAALGPTGTVAAATASSHTPTSVGFRDDTLPVHKLRAAYERVQEKSWQLIERLFSETTRLSDSARGKLARELFVYHNDYIADQLSVYERENKGRLQSVFPDFAHFYEWNYVESHINGTNSLFDVFREYLSVHVADVARPDFDKLGATDFAETVLFDKKRPVPKSFNDIHNIMVGQGLYYKLATVQFYDATSRMTFACLNILGVLIKLLKRPLSVSSVPSTGHH